MSAAGSTLVRSVQRKTSLKRVESNFYEETTEELREAEKRDPETGLTQGSAGLLVVKVVHKHVPPDTAR